MAVILAGVVNHTLNLEAGRPIPVLESLYNCPAYVETISFIHSLNTHHAGVMSNPLYHDFHVFQLL
jgi:hypothetical protein